MPAPESTTGAPSARPRSATVAVIGAIVALALLVLESPFFLTAGLAAPTWGVVLLIGIWVAIMITSVILLIRGRPWPVWAAPFVAALLWLAVITFGDLVLGWQA